jgi:ABC-2 type transport system permease protein
MDQAQGQSLGLAMVSWVPLLTMALMCWIFQRVSPAACLSPSGIRTIPRCRVSWCACCRQRQGWRRQSVLNRAEAADALLRMDVMAWCISRPIWKPKSSKAVAAW